MNTNNRKQTLKLDFRSYREIGSKLCMLFSFLWFVNAAEIKNQMIWLHCLHGTKAILGRINLSNLRLVSIIQGYIYIYLYKRTSFSAISGFFFFKYSVVCIDLF